MKMDTNKMIGLVVGVMVGIIIMSAALFPTIHASTDQTFTKTNVGSFFTTPDENEHTIVIDDTTITFDDNECIYPDLTLYGSATAMVGEDWFLRLELNTNNNLVTYILCGPPQQYVNLGNSSGGDLVITVSGTDVAFDGPSTDTTRNNLTYMIADKGDYVLSHDPYVLENTEFVGAIRNSTSLDIFELVTGSIGDTTTYDTTAVRIWSFSTTETGTLVSASYTVDLLNVYGDLKKLDKITETMDMTFTSAGDQSRTITIDYIIVPKEITYDNPAYVGDDLADLFSVIPILITVGLILGIVGAVFVRRLE